jgi:UDP-N-acetylmuramyl pentapeptide synthase
VQRELAGFAARRARKVAMEVSSHGLAQGRVGEVHFDAAVFTNLTRDHLDFHGDMQRYGAAKASLFEREDVRLRVFNVDDAFGAQLAARPAFADRIACSRLGGAEPAGRFVLAHDVRFDATGTQFAIASSFGSARVATRLLGEFNVDNVLAVLAVLLGSGVELQRAVDALQSLTAPSGRLEVLTRAGAPLVVVDYAHSPDALEKALQVLRRHCAGRLIAVFGCGGDRDRGKRPQMGAVAARLADAVVITDDNPRSESGDAIVAQILAGCAGSATPVSVQRDRRAAIAGAIGGAQAGDVVLVAGKGHEDPCVVGRAAVQRPGKCAPRSLGRRGGEPAPGAARTAARISRNSSTASGGRMPTTAPTWAPTRAALARTSQFYLALRGPRFDGDPPVADGPAALTARHGAGASASRSWWSASPAATARPPCKEMIAAILAQAAPCLATRGNLNNHIGVPLTLLRLDPGIAAR